MKLKIYTGSMVKKKYELKEGQTEIVNHVYTKYIGFCDEMGFNNKFNTSAALSKFVHEIFGVKSQKIQKEKKDP